MLPHEIICWTHSAAGTRQELDGFLRTVPRPQVWDDKGVLERFKCYFPLHVCELENVSLALPFSNDAVFMYVPLKV